MMVEYWGCYNTVSNRWMINKRGEVSYFPTREIAEANIKSMPNGKHYVVMMFSGYESKLDL